MKSNKNIALSISLLVIVFYIFGVFSSASSNIGLDSSIHFSNSQHTPKFLHSKSLSVTNFANIDTKESKKRKPKKRRLLLLVIQQYSYLPRVKKQNVLIIKLSISINAEIFTCISRTSAYKFPPKHSSF